MKKLLLYFGWVKKQPLDEKIIELEAKIKDYEKMFEGDIVPKITFQEYTRNNNKSWNENFSDYYELYHRKEHSAYKIRMLSLTPQFLDVFIRALCKFDFEAARKHMEDENWKWADEKTTPTINDLINCVITLTPSNGEPTEISSGGFTVKFGYENNKAFCGIKFKKQ
jgi:hypothetical protein